MAEQVEADFTKLNKLLEEFDSNYYVDIGILGGKGETDRDGMTLAAIAAVLYFGSYTQNIPPRNMIDMPITVKEDSIQKAAEAVLQESFEALDLKRIFKIIGIAAESAIKEAFETGGFGNWPDISDETKQRKGSDGILLDTGLMKNAVTSKVGGNK